MVNPMNKKSFIKTGEAAVATYEYTDIANGTGIVEFLGGGMSISGAAHFIKIGGGVELQNFY